MLCEKSAFASVLVGSTTNHIQNTKSAQQNNAFIQHVVTSDLLSSLPKEAATRRSIIISTNQSSRTNYLEVFNKLMRSGMQSLTCFIELNSACYLHVN